MQSLTRLWMIAFWLIFCESPGLFAGIPNELSRPLNVNQLEDGGFIGPQIEFLRDPGKNLGFEKIKDPALTTDFERGQTQVINFGFTSDVVWLRIHLENKEPTEKDIVLEYNYPNIDHLSVFIPDANGNFIERKAGDSDPSYESALAMSRTPTFLVTARPGITTLFMRLETEGALQIPIRAWNSESINRKTVIENAMLALVYGVFAVMIFYNFLLCLWFRSTSYFVYVLFIAASTLSFLILQGFTQLLFPRSWAVSLSGYLSINANLSIILALFFGRSLLDLQSASRTLNRLFLLSSALALAGIGVAFFSYNYSMKFFIGNNLFSVGLLFWAGVYQSYRGYRPAYFFTVSWLAVLCGHVALVLTAIGLLPYNFITSFGAFVGSALEVALLSLALGDKMRFAQQQDKRHIAQLYKDLQKRNEEILNLNQHLEEMVEEKTRDIRSIMKNIRQGIFTIGSDLCIKGDTSEFLQEVFDEKDLQGRKALDVIFTHSEVSMDVRNQTETALLASLHEDVMVFTMNENLLCREILQQKEGKLQKVLEVDWNPVIKDNLVNRILVTIKDVTEQRLLRRQHDEREKEVQMFEQILSVKLTSFKKFAQSTAHLLEDCRTAITSGQDERETLKKLYANLHTIKGASRTIGLDFLSEVVHHAENELQEAILRKKVIDKAQLTSELHDVHEIFQSYMTIFSEKLGAHMTSPDSLEVSRELLYEMVDELRNYLNQNRYDEDRTKKFIAEQYGRLQKIVFPTLQQLILSMAPIVQSAAASLGKHEPRLHIEGGDSLLATESCEEMLQHIFVHIFRNSIDHGIETDSERATAGKPVQGTISVVISLQPGFVCLAVSDDGKGINLTAIREKAIRQNLLAADAHVDASAVAELIFHSGFSTKDHVSAISGRGAGMDAVRAYVEKFGGKAEIELGADKSQGFRDFQLRLKLPLNLVLSARPQGMELAS